MWIPNSLPDAHITPPLTARDYWADAPELTLEPVELDPEPTGNTAECYTCGFDFSRYPQFAVRKNYVNQADRKRSFFLTLCSHCDLQFRAKK